MSDELTTKKLTCIQCPRGCHLSLLIDDRPRVVSVEGNGCELGPVWARQEVEDPVRILTTSVRVEGGVEELVSVKTSASLPRRRLFEAMEAVRALRVTAPLAQGQVLAADLAGTGVDLLATRSVAAFERSPLP